MELKTYLRILAKRRWIVIPVFLITVAGAALFSLLQPPTFSTTATFVLAPSSASFDTRGVLSGLDVLGARTEVAATYSEVPVSRIVRQQAADALGLSPTQAKDLWVSSKVRAGTNVMEITVEGADPALISAYANEVGDKTIVYVEKLYGIYVLEALDPAATPVSPVRPNTKMDLALGAALGLVLGAGLAFLVEYFHTPAEVVSRASILDEESGACNQSYFDRRLTEEMSRARRRECPLSLALLDVDVGHTMQKSVPSESRGDALRMVTTFYRQSLRDEDVLARLQGTTFGLLLPDVPEDEAKALLGKLQTQAKETTFKVERCDVKLNLRSAAGLVSYDCNGMGRHDLLVKARRALKRAQANGGGKVSLSSENRGE